ncbi:Flagellar biosynthesis GTPase FlhF [Mariprofundus ferrinatatus]|uniref:Flagellar biosynthesis GTPase FlhF n=1 Tax=Mariprofundus ferrinatatus TaxID=1921087 RepID=A0A2K8L6H3_9PROT|nr:AAA family ATPase [Mariprofundus ferrinatatus]ATX82935.1 Flagellar biosynthesis GTPase FlhF [Mariprofundus ferrinatatus]
MQIKIFSAPKLHEALAKVRQGYGPDAIIMDRHKSVDENGEPVWHVHAARDVGDSMQVSKASAENRSVDSENAHKKLLTAMSQLERIVDGLGRQEFEGLRASLPDQRSKHGFDTLIKLGVAPNFASDIAEDFVNNAPVAEELLTWGSAINPTEKREVVLLSGPSGCGKTTLAAKLAAHFMINGASVAFLSTDTERIGGLNDLQTFATSLGVPLVPVARASDIEPALRQVKSAQLVLVDTESYSRNQPVKLRKQFDLWNQIPCSRKFVVLPANMDEADGMETLLKAQKMGINELAFSKLDETSYPGKLINWAASGIAISYCSFGPEIPEQMGWLSAKAITALLDSQTKTKESS